MPADGTGNIYITFENIVSSGDGQVTLGITGSQFVLDGYTFDTQMMGISGFSGVAMSNTVIVFVVPPQTAMAGSVTLTATWTGADPTLTLSGFGGSGPMMTYSPGVGGMSIPQPMPDGSPILLHGFNP